MQRHVAFRCPACGVSGTAMQKEGEDVFCPGNFGDCGAVCDIRKIGGPGCCTRCSQPIDDHALDDAGMIEACPARVEA